MLLRRRRGLPDFAPQDDAGEGEAALADVGHFDELVGGADLFRSGIAERAAQLVGAGLFDGVADGVEEAALERIAVDVAPGADGVSAVAAVDLLPVVAE